MFRKKASSSLRMRRLSESNRWSIERGRSSSFHEVRGLRGEGDMRPTAEETSSSSSSSSNTVLQRLLQEQMRYGDSRNYMSQQPQLLPMEDTCWLLHHLLNNTRDWDSQLPQICVALTDLTENHHNLRRLVQLLPDHKRGKQLRKHLSVSIISKLLNRRCTYKPVTTEFQLSALQQYLPRMRPSSLLPALFSVKTTEDQGEEDCSVSLDQQAYYLCYSLLALTNEATNFETFPSNQKDQLDLLSAELEKYIKCDIREGEKWLYRSKVKDFVARIYTRWQILLHKSRPMQGKLHHFWQPLPEDTLSSSQESQQPQSESVTHTPEPQTGGIS